MTVTRWDKRDGTRGYSRGRELVRPRIIIEDPPDPPRTIEIDWSYVAAVALQTPGRWLRVLPDVDNWVPKVGITGGTSRPAPIRRNNIRIEVHGNNLYVRYDVPSDD